MRLYIVFLGFMVLVSACQEVDTPIQQSDNPAIFFDLDNFFQQEKARLEKVSSFTKTVSINGVSETKELTALDLDNELSIFIASDINRPAWSDKYKVDSLLSTTKQLNQLIYTALDETLKTKKLTVSFQNNQVANIAIEKATDNAVAQSKQSLTYTVDKGYAIQSQQALSLSEAKTILVQVNFQ